MSTTTTRTPIVSRWAADHEAQAIDWRPIWEGIWNDTAPVFLFKTPDSMMIWTQDREKGQAIVYQAYGNLSELIIPLKGLTSVYYERNLRSGKKGGHRWLPIAKFEKYAQAVSTRR